MRRESSFSYIGDFNEKIECAKKASTSFYLLWPSSSHEWGSIKQTVFLLTIVQKFRGQQPSSLALARLIQPTAVILAHIST